MNVVAVQQSFALILIIAIINFKATSTVVAKIELNAADRRSEFSSERCCLSNAIANTHN